HGVADEILPGLNRRCIPGGRGRHDAINSVPAASRPGAASIEQVGVPGQVRQDHVHKIGRPVLAFIHSHLC
ncbi:MAG: hypothetical protein J2P47_15630, partial [Acetobacteraceae bacterium]|nr:hypothetical protein [Acetobacteraceae bacterium]